MREGGVLEHDLAGRDLNELVARAHAAHLLGRTSGDRIDRNRYIDRRLRHVELMCRRNGAGGAVEIKLQGVVQGNGDARLRRSLPHRDWRNQHFGEPVTHALVAERWIAAVERLETAGKESSRSHYRRKPRGCADALAVVTPPH